MPHTSMRDIHNEATNYIRRPITIERKGQLLSNIQNDIKDSPFIPRSKRQGDTAQGLLEQLCGSPEMAYIRQVASANRGATLGSPSASASAPRMPPAFAGGMIASFIGRRVTSSPLAPATASKSAPATSSKSAPKATVTIPAPSGTDEEEDDGASMGSLEDPMLAGAGGGSRTRSADEIEAKANMLQDVVDSAGVANMKIGKTSKGTRVEMVMGDGSTKPINKLGKAELKSMEAQLIRVRDSAPTDKKQNFTNYLKLVRDEIAKK